MLVDPLRGVEPEELFTRAGLPSALAPAALTARARNALANKLWNPASLWRADDARASAAFRAWMALSSRELVLRMPAVGLMWHARLARGLLRASDQQAVGAAVGKANHALLFEPDFQLLDGDLASLHNGLSKTELLASPHATLEREGCVVMAATAGGWGRAWHELLRLKLPRRLEPHLSHGLVFDSAQANAVTVRILEFLISRTVVT